MITKRIFLLIFFIYCSGFIGHAILLHKTVYGDGIYYYTWLRSISIDHDVHFQNEYRNFGIEQPFTVTRLAKNIYSIGPALLWIPAYLPFHSAMRGSGYEFSYQFLVGFVSVLYVFIGLIVLYLLLIKYFSTQISRLTITSIALATNLLFYGSVDTVNSHSLTFFVASLYMYFLLDQSYPLLYSGFLLGLLGLLRPLDLLFGLLLLHRVSFKSVLFFLLGFTIAFAPQLLVSYKFYGSPISSPYVQEGFGFPFLQNPYIFQVLLSNTNGLFFWTPMIAIGFLGLLWGTFKRKQYYSNMTLLFFFEVYFIASWSIWWQGATFSGRMFVSQLPLIAFGLAFIIQKGMSIGFRADHIVLRIICPLILLNFVLIYIFLLNN